MIKIMSRFGGHGVDTTEEAALQWAKHKMATMVCGCTKGRLHQVNKFLVGIQFTLEDLTHGD